MAWCLTVTRAGKSPFQFKIDETNDQQPTSYRRVERRAKGMQPGEHRTLFIPASLGMAARAKHGIPANSTLIFETKLVADRHP